ncbi:MAG TPA: hypothetical protein VKS43_01640 [Burkholderiales bacterium]|nr:hypothetical protein [Burkholderiales bacterium]
MNDAFVAPKAKKPDQVAILTRESSGYCVRAKKLLKDLGYDYAAVPLGHANRSRIGGLDELEKWSKKAV